ncbi:MAG: Protein FecR [Stenotrophomonas maltophilia]|nr:MAG: Protein FecR [Stenotrophomonas maltophilia]
MTVPPPSPTPDPDSLAQALDWLVQLDDADAQVRARFDAWCAARPEHLQAFRHAQQLWESPLLGAAAAELEQRQDERRAPRRRSRWRSYAAAACLLLATGLTLQGDLLLHLRADHLTAVGERQNFNLADGSRVLLNTNTAFSSRIDEHSRSARLYRGEAFFDVAHDRSRPFEVEAGPVQVSVRGTAFAVRYLGEEAEVSVERGEVDLLSRQDDSRMSLAAGDSIRVGPDGFGQRRHGGDTERQLAWVRGRLMFENCPLRQVVAELRRYYPGWIVSADEQLADRAVTGNYRLDDPLGAMRSLAQVTSANLHEFPHLLILN